MALFAYDNKTKALAQVNESSTRRQDSDAQVQLALHEHLITQKEQQAERQGYDSLMVKQKITQDLENETLRQELDELKRQSSAYARAQHHFSQTFQQAAGQFMNRVVTPTMAMANKSFAAKPEEGADKAAQHDDTSNTHAQIYPFSNAADLGVKAAI
jgi:hypothetical protein